VNDKRAQVRGWVQTRQLFSGMAWPIFARFHHPLHNLSSQNQTALLRKNIQSFGRRVELSVGGPRQE